VVLCVVVACKSGAKRLLLTVYIVMRLRSDSIYMCCWRCRGLRLRDSIYIVMLRIASACGRV
jgi:hypothetical protein